MAICTRYAFVFLGGGIGMGIGLEGLGVVSFRYVVSSPVEAAVKLEEENDGGRTEGVVNILD